MLDKDRIFAHFRTMSGLDEAGAVPYRSLCDSAAQYVFNRLRPDVQLDRNMDRLCVAGAALAYGDWLELGGALSAGQELRVGDITLRENSGSAPARGALMREHFLAGVADLLTTRFVLAGIGGEAQAGEESS